MTDDVELEYERDLSREEIADYLERFADGLRDGDEIELTVGGETTAVNPPETVEFELEVEDEPEDDGVERSVEFELEWMRTDEEE
ncbi:amphi-Trp domain-containing protein [Natrialbaceae archaeon A-gly3]